MTERRKHKMFVTLNTEYHLRENRCVGVRNRISDSWEEHHVTLGYQLCGSIAYSGDGLMVSRDPQEGQSLWFEGQGMHVITSSVQYIQRPPKEAVHHYALH